MVRFERGKNDDSRTYLTKFSEHARMFIFTILNAVINTIIRYLNSLIGIILSKTWIYLILRKIIWMWMMLSSEYIQLKICKTFVRHQGMVLWFRRWDLVWEQVSASSDYWYSKTLWKGSRKEFQKPCGCLNFTQAGVYIRLGYSSYVNGHI